MPWYQPAAVASDLAGDLVTGWVATTEGHHQLVPDGCVDVLWVGNGSAWVCGPDTAAWSFTLPPGTPAVGVRFRPGRAGTVLGVDTGELRDRRVRLDDVIGARAGRQVVAEVGDVGESTGRLVALQRHVRRWLATAPPTDPVADAVTAMLTADATTTVAALAEATGLSGRQLHRRCTSAFGYGPATLRRILRLQRFVALARRAGAASDLARLAVAAGYADQPHLYRDCRTIAGATPRALVASPLTDAPACPIRTRQQDRGGAFSAHDRDR